MCSKHNSGLLTILQCLLFDRTFAITWCGKQPSLRWRLTVKFTHVCLTPLSQHHSCDIHTLIYSSVAYLWPAQVIFVIAVITAHGTERWRVQIFLWRQTRRGYSSALSCIPSQASSFRRWIARSNWREHEHKHCDEDWSRASSLMIISEKSWRVLRLQSGLLIRISM